MTDLDINKVEERLRQLVELAGSDQAAADLISTECGGGPDRSALSRMRRGEGKPTIKILTVYALENALKRMKKIS